MICYIFSRPLQQNVIIVMKKKKLSLENLRVKSFITSTEALGKLHGGKSVEDGGSDSDCTLSHDPNDTYVKCLTVTCTIDNNSLIYNCDAIL